MSELLDNLDILVRMLDACSALSTAANHPVLLPDTHHYDKPKGNQRFIRVYRQGWNKPWLCRDCDDKRKAQGFDWYLKDQPDCTHEKVPTEGQRFVDFFVERDTGLVWKAAGWKAPTLNFPRGEVNTPEGRYALTGGRLSDSGHFYSGH